VKSALKLIKVAQSYIIDFIVRHGIIAKLLSRIGATGDSILQIQFGYNIYTLDVLPNTDIVCSTTEIPINCKMIAND
jgi:hypothetical protein